MKKKTTGKRKLVLKKTAIVELNTTVTNANNANGTLHCTHPTTTVMHTFDC